MALSFLSQRGRFSPRTLRLWLLCSWLAGVYLLLAAPVALPGGWTEQVQKMLVHGNFQDLAGRGLLPMLAVLLVGAGLGLLLFAATLLVARWDPPCARPPARRWAWLKFSLLIVLAWTVYLLAFWPGVLSADSLQQWQQVQTGQYNNAHPAFHTLSIWLVTRLWNSPAAVALAQILMLAALVGWELGVLRRRGLPEGAAWLAALIFALSPVNGITVITLWKDIPYSAALLWLSFLILNITLEPGEALSRRSTWLALGLASGLIALFRHNGLVVGPVVLVSLALVYRRYWRGFAAAFALFALIWLVVQGPLYTLLRVERSATVTASLSLHHIAAHVASGESLSTADRAVVERILPLDQWKYNCYTINPILFHPQLDSQYIVEHTGAINQLALRLLLRHPTVDVDHTLCAGSMVYRIGLAWESYFYTEQARRDETGKISYITSNQQGLAEQPLLPGLTGTLVDFYGWSNLRGVTDFIWRPASYLYLLLLLGCALALRARSWKLGLFLLPAIVQSGVLFLVNIGQGFRYQYAIYMLALFCLALIFLPVQSSGDQPRAGIAS